MRVVRSSGDAIEGAGIGHSAVPLMFTAVFHHNCCSDDLRALCVPSAAPSPRGATPSTSVDYFCAVSVPPVDPPVSAPSSTTTTTNNNNTTNTPKHQRTTVDPSFNEENFFRNPEAHPSEVKFRTESRRSVLQVPCAVAAPPPPTVRHPWQHPRSRTVPRVLSAKGRFKPRANWTGPRVFPLRRLPL